MKNSKSLVLILALLSMSTLLTGCLGFSESENVMSQEMSEYLRTNKDYAHLGQVRFISDDLGSLSYGGLFKANIMPIKLYGAALLLDERRQDKNNVIDGKRIPDLMQKFGFINPKKIENWHAEWAPEPKVTGSVGFIHGTLKKSVPIFNFTFKVEVANLTCAACHSSVTYDRKGNPTGNVWLGSPNSSLNLDGFLGSIYSGLKIGIQDKNKFLKVIRQAYPEIDSDEIKTIKEILLPQVEISLLKFKKMNRVLPFPNGGPGITNGIGAFKRNAKLASKYNFNTHEAGFVSIPDISDRGFRSSLLYDGIYVPKGEARFREIPKDEAVDPDHLLKLGQMATFFSYSAMGNLLQNIEPAMPRVREIFSFLKELKPPPFPLATNSDLAAHGAKVFAQSCSQYHGSYNTSFNSSLAKPELESFPNVSVPQDKMGTDPLRWQGVSAEVKKFADQSVFGKYSDAGMNLGGYVAPILSGVWSSAPYLHNGSVPTLWHLMHPEARPSKFEVGGHAVDLEKLGIRGELNERGVYAYPSDYKEWSMKSVYDVTEPGKSNKGHEAEFADLTEEDKTALLEYLKLL